MGHFVISWYFPLWKWSHGHTMARWKSFRAHQLVGIKMATLVRLKSGNLVPSITVNRGLVFILRFPDLSSSTQRSTRPHLPLSPVLLCIIACTCIFLPSTRDGWSILDSSPTTLPVSFISTPCMGMATAHLDHSWEIVQDSGKWNYLWTECLISAVWLGHVV